MTRKNKRISRSRQRPNRDELYPLDRFSQVDLRTWQRASDQLTEFRIRQHYLLEGLRAVHHDEINEALRSVESTKLPLDRWTRIVDWKYSLEPLSPAGSLIVGGRFNIGRDIDPQKYPEFPTLYIAENYETAFHERFGAGPKSTMDKLSGQEFALRSPGSFTSVRVKGELHNVFDIAVANSLQAFVAIIGKFGVPADLKALAKILGMRRALLLKDAAQVKQTLLASNWRYWPVQYGIPASPQVFGKLLMEAGFDAVVYPSTIASGRCVAVFVSNFAASDSYIEVMDPCPEGVMFPRLDHVTYQDWGGRIDDSA